MHMADALLSPAVAVTMYAASAAAAGVSLVQLRREELAAPETAKKKLPTMAVMSALVFAGQMINYTIPGTGSSGHLCGGMLLSAMLGPWAGFLSMIVILAIQALFFADGGLLALGANVWNMAFYGCFVGYFLIYRPLMRGNLSAGKARLRLTLASVLGCVATLQLGAFSVVLETTLSGITALPLGAFAVLMQPIHLAIGLVEGLITAAVLLFLYEARPELLRDVRMSGETTGKASFKGTIAVIAIAAVLVGGGLSLLASGNPDGLEWSLFGNSDAGYTQNMGLDEDSYGVQSSAADKAGTVQEKTAFLPDYSFAGSDSAAGTSVSGIAGAAIVAAAVFFFLVPSHVSVGSISGLAVVLENFIPLPISMITMILNVALLIVGFLFIGREFGGKTVYTSFLLPVIIGILEKLFPNNGSMTGDPFLDMLCYVFVVSIGLSILFNCNASSGGLDIVAKLMNKYLRMDLGKAMALSGMCVALSSALVYDKKIVVLSVLGTYLNGLVLDHFIFGAKVKRRVCILSKKEEEIRKFIIEELHSGATIYEAIGAYDFQPHREIITIVDKHEYSKLMSYLMKTDREAFITVYTVNEIIYRPKP